MGLRKVANLEISQLAGPHDPPAIWSRDGFRGVCVRHDKFEISIPREVLMELLTQEYVDIKISQLEQMDVSDVEEMVFGKRS